MPNFILKIEICEPARQVWSAFAPAVDQAATKSVFQNLELLRHRSRRCAEFVSR
jgi:hypothetical protein